MESEKIRIENPGLCAIDFENVIGIVVEEILGWDQKNNCNKVWYGLFGDLDAWSFAVEEQGRKPLHTHFLLWVKGYNGLIEGLSTPEGQEEYVKQVSKYVDRVMSTRLHGFNPRSVPNACSKDCTSVGEGIEGYLKCTTQDLRQFANETWGNILWRGKNAMVSFVQCKGFK
ncbi:hypothetical protein IV203_027039 [Nitzschia inconspicua]|uniref:Helitron helicase-like domain-containing protein n=1 Tax=Nitzschia inconspicua TaxID=303405 RepID=A0A9K3LL37_9STRA|nr:hypothetical protein IV203_027039 [Nitzschia inconspicua]